MLLSRYKSPCHSPSFVLWMSFAKDSVRPCRSPPDRLCKKDCRVLIEGFNALIAGGKLNYFSAGTLGSLPSAIRLRELYAFATVIVSIRPPHNSPFSAVTAR